MVSEIMTSEGKFFKVPKGDTAELKKGARFYVYENGNKKIRTMGAQKVNVQGLKLTTDSNFGFTNYPVVIVSGIYPNGICWFNDAGTLVEWSSSDTTATVDYFDFLKYGGVIRALYMLLHQHFHSLEVSV